jgi:carbon-monoxide dehydrogenase small subunit
MMSPARVISFTVNGEKTSLHVEDNWTLLRLLREELALTGTKEGCGKGECGACTVIVDGKPVNSCLVLAVEVDGSEILTIEGEGKMVGNVGGRGADKIWGKGADRGDGTARATSKGTSKGEGRNERAGLSPLQQAFIDHGGFQCGFCTAGMIMSARALLMQNPNPTEDEVKEAISGNLCRCTGYKPIIEAILDAAYRERDEGERVET